MRSLGNSPRKILWPLLLIAAADLCGLAQSKPAAPAAAAPAAPAPAVSYASEGLIVEQSDTICRYQADGTGEKDVYTRIKVQSEAGARRFSVLSLAYAAANDTPHIESVVVRHPDGTSTETPPSDAMDMPMPVTQQAPLYSDLKQLQIPVRGLRAGDVLEYRLHLERKNPESPSQFWQNYVFEKSAVVLSETLTLDVPAGKYVKVWSPDYKPTEADKGGRHTYTWTGNQLKPTSGDSKKNEAVTKESDLKPDVAWTTFHSWAEVGAWYRSLAAPRTVPTDALRAQAAEITRDAKTPLDQVQALYAFVSTHIRYVGIDFGIGRFQPHMPAEVLANQYGDCKDKDTLLESLLLAKGLTPAPALIGVNIAMVADLPSPAFFNHVITTVSLPDGRIWMDSTPGVAPFQLLVAPVRDKQALLIPATGDAGLDRTPAQPPYPFVDTFEATATLTKEGELNGKVRASFRSDGELLMRLVAENLAPAQWDQGTQELANMWGFSGTTSNSSFGRADDTTQPMEVSYDYNRKTFGDWDNLRIVSMFPVIALPEGPEKLPTAEIDLGSLRTERVLSKIELPAGFNAELPNAIHVKTPFATFDLTYQFEKGVVTSERKLTILESKLPEASWEQYKKFTKDISLGDLAWIQLSAPPAAGSAAKNPTPQSETSASGTLLLSEAAPFERNENWDAALAKLDELKKLSPEEPYLWSNYGYVAMHQKHITEAIEDYKHEFDHHPDEAFVVQLYAGSLMANGRQDEAIQVLKSYLDHNVNDVGAGLMLAQIQAQTSLADAIATMRRAVDASPDKPLLKLSLARFLNQNHQPAEASALLKTLLSINIDDDSFLNDAAYEMALTDTELPLAEEKSRKSLDILADKTAGTTISEANPESFMRSLRMVASWDTLGYILLQEKKLDEAREYIEASWHNAPNTDECLHYGQVLEALGDAKAALRIYELGRSPRPVHPPSESPTPQIHTLNPAAGQIKESIDRLIATHVPEPAKLDAAAELQADRTFKVKAKATGSFWSGTFRLQLTAAGPDEVLQVGGAPRDRMQEDIMRVPFPQLVPAHFKGKLLRDAIVTCSPGATECEVVLMPQGPMAMEQQSQWSK